MSVFEAFAWTFLVKWFRDEWRSGRPSKTEWDKFTRNPATHRRNADLCIHVRN